MAVHDVTGSQSNMTLDYMHMDKYDVVDWDVHTVGNGGCSTITFKGNGFRDLYAVDLTIDSGETIHSVDISHGSDAETAVTFDFTGSELGDYIAVFHFTEEDKHVANVVTVEEAVDIELATEVSFPSSFLRGTSATYNIKITNKGNMTAYAVPIYTWLKSKTLDDIYHIEYNGLDLDDILDYMDKDSILLSEMSNIQAYNEKKGDDHYFLKFWVEDEDNPGDSVVVRSNYFYTNISPNETKTLQLTIYTRNVDAFAYFTIPDEWPTYSIVENSESFVARARFGSKKSESWYCCYRDRIECIANIVVDGLDIASLFSVPGPTAVNIASCVAGIVNQIITAAGDTYCGTNDVEGDFKKKVDKVVKGISIVGALTSCASAFGVKNASEITVAIDNLLHPFAAVNCIQSFFSKKPNCPPTPPNGGKSKSQPPADPNDIYGYLSEAGNKFIADHVEKINYTVEFENDPTFAEASAHTIVIKDTLDSRYFDLKAFTPTGIKIGSREVSIGGDDVVTNNDKTTFVKTIDMRPEINAIAQVEGTFSQKTGIVEWRFTSLDPMSMEPTNDLMQGILPVNYDGTSGIGEVLFEIGVKPNKADGTEVPNRAGIVFDYEEVIMTPTWKNIVDGTAPTSYVADVQMATDTTAAVRIVATDELSGPWRYNVYVQYGDGAWFLGAENVPIDKVANVKVYEGIDHGFYTVVTDSAGNVEQKDAAREFTLEVFGSQVETNTQLALAEGWNWISHNQQEALSAETLKPKAQRIVSQTEELYKDSHFGWSGDLDELLPTEMYKVQMTEAEQVQLSGLLFNAAFRSVPLREGWNWIGYPVNKTMTPTEALAKLEAEEGDVLIGQDGMAQYNDGQWTGTLMELNPGHGYMYRSVSDKNLFLNATAQSSSRRAFVQRRKSSDQYSEVWQTDKRKYPNVMGTVIRLCKNGEAVNADEWLVGAFCGDECRGVAEPVSDVLMMNVYGRGNEQIVFRVIHRESGELVGVSGQEAFRTDLLGTMQQPYELNIGQLTGIKEIDNLRIDDPQSIYDLQGRKIDNGQSVNGKLNRGVYIVTDSNNSQTQKVVTK